MKPTSGARPTLVLLVRHGLTATTGRVLPGRAPGLHLSDDGRRQADGVARRIATLPRVAAVYASPLPGRHPAAPAFTNRLLRQAAQADLDAPLARGEAIQPLLLCTEDHKEAVRAFGEKRPPRFSGR